MATVKQLENWLHRTHDRVEKFKGLLKEETTRKKELVRPKTPEQVKQKENIIKSISRYRDEMNHSKNRKKELEAQLKEAKRVESHPTKKALKSVEKALTRKFNQKSNEQLPKKGKGKGKAADNRIRLPELSSPASKKMSVEDRLQSMEGRLYGLEQDLSSLEKLLREGNAEILQALADLRS